MNHPYTSNTFGQQDSMTLVNTLNTMYADNQRTIQSLTQTLNRLVESNIQIQNHLYHVLSNNRVPRRSGNSRALARINEPRIFRTHSEWDTIGQLLQEIVADPVVLPLTTAEIETATRRVRYSDITRPVNSTCPISMEDFQDSDMVTVIRHCGHTFYTDPLMNWFRTNSKCPVCRHDLREDNHTTESPWNAWNTFIASHQSSGSRVDEPSYQIYTEGVYDISGNSLSDIFLHTFRNITRR